ncbi:MAG: DNA repair protein RecO [Candidatus Pacebacteria bacterium]|nr:DNA repair protein RecO [Candidatus Paceibacterota bacterium]
MSTYKTEGIIIKRNNFLEASLILDIWTKDYGKVEAVARSARKAKGKLKGHLELFLDTELILAHGKNIDTITSSLTINSFSNLRNNLEFSFGGYYILELVDRMTIEGHQDERVFCLLKEVLLFLDVGTRQCLVPTAIAMTTLLFQINLLNLTGFSPELNKCVLCGKPIKAGKNHFSFSMGGIVGQECILQKEAERPIGRSASRALISDNAIKLLRLFQFKGGDLREYNSHLNKCFEIIGKLKVEEKLVLDSVFLMNRFIEFNVERKIKGVDFLRGM